MSKSESWVSPLQGWCQIVLEYAGHRGRSAPIHRRKAARVERLGNVVEPLRVGAGRAADELAEHSPISGGELVTFYLEGVRQAQVPGAKLAGQRLFDAVSQGLRLVLPVGVASVLKADRRELVQMHCLDAVSCSEGQALALALGDLQLFLGVGARLARISFRASARCGAEQVGRLARRRRQWRLAVPHCQEQQRAQHDDEAEHRGGAQLLLVRRIRARLLTTV